MMLIRQGLPLWVLKTVRRSWSTPRYSQCPPPRATTRSARSSSGGQGFDHRQVDARLAREPMLQTSARLVLSICFFVLLLGITPRARADSPLESLQTASASRLRSGLPDEPFAAWIQGVVGEGTKIVWSGPYGCEENAGLCFSAEAAITDCGKVDVIVAVLRAGADVEEEFRVEMIHIEGLGPTQVFTNLTTLQARLEEAKRVDRELRAKPLQPIDGAEAIAYVKALDVKQLDGGLSSRPLGEWFEELADSDSSISWQLEGCEGWPEGTLGVRPCADFWACVVGKFENPRETVRVTVKVGTYRRGIFGAPELYSASLFQISGPSWRGKHLLTYHKERKLPKNEKDVLQKLPVVLRKIRD